MLLTLALVRIAILIVIAFLYAMFDVFNKRNMPPVFAYASVAIGFILTLTYPSQTVIYSVVVAAVVAVVGYVTYRMGVLGSGDIYEFVFISLVLPVLATPYSTSVMQYGLPFILSVLIAAGLATVLLAPLYYIRKSAKRHGGLFRLKIRKRRMIEGTAILAVYAFLFVSLTYIAGFELIRLLIVLLIALPAAIVLIYEDEIYEGMVERVYPSALEEGDMIATNMMSEKDMRYFKKISKSFGRLVTGELIQKIKKARKRIPVYKNAVPLALFTFIGIIVALLLGNLILLMLV